MPLVGVESEKSRRQNLHSRRQKVAAKASSSDKQEPATLPIPPNPTTTPTKPKSILRRGSSNVAQQNQVVADSNSTPATPPRPTSMYDTISESQEGEVSTTEPKGQRRRRSEKPQGHKHSGSTSAMPSLGTPQPKERQQSMAPGRTNATPLQAYAGPTFHASPAASALPLPKFFSKSVPAAEKGTSLSTMMEKEVKEVYPEPPSDENEESPTFGKAQCIGETRVREESPLDIFFKADRREKARQHSESTIKTPIGAFQSPSTCTPPFGSVLSLNKDVRHHSRHATGSSMGEVFPLDIDDRALNSTETHDPSNELSSFSTSSVRPNSAPPDAAGQADAEEEQRKAKTLLLKKLLMSPQLQRPTEASSQSELKPNHRDSSMREQSLCVQRSPGQDIKGSMASATNTPGARSVVAVQDLKHAASLPRLQGSLNTKEKNTGSPRSRPQSSNLRKEIPLPASPIRTDLPELPATPTPSRVSNQYVSPKPQAHKKINTNGNASAFIPDFTTNKIFQGMDNTPTQGSNSTKSMEDDLRRILKLNVLGGTGANGIQF